MVDGAPGQCVCNHLNPKKICSGKELLDFSKPTEFVPHKLKHRFQSSQTQETSRRKTYFNLSFLCSSPSLLRLHRPVRGITVIDGLGRCAAITGVEQIP
ncbi:hypothetical protein scyTo_0005448 [Scyliorhinus torazame]|uniref:Uncharacterized protein n=1 Tax=Scyliorhinus torazame TaxID=75743 RepID=A0A401P815_SCYTO|nr:hypothetical protein [Scyliorhinus torazame]